MGSGSPPTPQVAAPLPAAPAPPQLPSAEVQAAGAATQKQAQSAAGVTSTILTGPAGVNPNQQNTANKQLTGD